MFNEKIIGLTLNALLQRWWELLMQKGEQRRVKPAQSSSGTTLALALAMRQMF